MLFLLLLLVLLGLAALAIQSLFYRKRDDKSVRPEPQKRNGTDNCASQCAGNNASCTAECMLRAAVEPAEYYEDEELDLFKGRPADSYNDNEIEQFRDVLYTLRPGEVTGWVCSLQKRGIALPLCLNDEMRMSADKN